MMKKRYFFTLIEISIALFLLSILLGALFGWLRHFSLEGKQKGDTLEALLEENYADKRLKAFFSKADLRPYFFTSEQETLIFTFDHGANDDALFAGSCLGELAFNEEHHVLILHIWPHPYTEKTSPCIALPLLDHVIDCQWSFYFPPSLSIVNPDSVGKTLPKKGWQSVWHKEYGQFPTMVKILLKRSLDELDEPHEIEYIYHLANASHPRVIYPQ